MHEVSGANDTQFAHLRIGKELSFEVTKSLFHECIVLTSQCPRKGFAGNTVPKNIISRRIRFFAMLRSRST